MTYPDFAVLVISAFVHGEMVCSVWPVSLIKAQFFLKELSLSWALLAHLYKS
jgi:hypothetical protein